MTGRQLSKVDPELLARLAARGRDRGLAAADAAAGQLPAVAVAVGVTDEEQALAFAGDDLTPTVCGRRTSHQTRRPHQAAR